MLQLEKETPFRRLLLFPDEVRDESGNGSISRYNSVSFGGPGWLAWMGNKQTFWVFLCMIRIIVIFFLIWERLDVLLEFDTSIYKWMHDYKNLITYE